MVVAVAVTDPADCDGGAGSRADRGGGAGSAEVLE